jgi:hypothetical protein
MMVSVFEDGEHLTRRVNDEAVLLATAERPEDAITPAAITGAADTRSTKRSNRNGWGAV